MNLAKLFEMQRKLDEHINYARQEEGTSDQFHDLWGACRSGGTRATTIKSQVRMYYPKKSRDYKQYVRLVAAQNRPPELLTGPLQLRVKVYKPTLKSWVHLWEDIIKKNPNKFYAKKPKQ